jgi:nickel-dependent lactate racemase
MNIYHLPYGDTEQTLTIPERFSVDIITSKDIAASTDPLRLVEAALDEPLDGFSLKKFDGVRTAAIAINDKTRPVQYEFLIPPLLNRLAALNISAENIRFIVATGTHKPASAAEAAALCPGCIAERYQIVSHNCDDQANLVELGRTSANTPVIVNRSFMDADLRIVVGNIEPHHFMGFSGGVKTASIGLASRQTITTNHSMLVDPRANVGVFEQNPMRQDIEEIGRMMGVHFALNVIPNDEQQIVRVLAGTPQSVITKGVSLSRELCQISVGEPYDLVIASAGGYPKDINLYQAQKALTHASLITRPGGAVITIAECREGSGSTGFEEFISASSSPAEVIERFKQMGFEIGPHKAFMVAREALRIQIALISSMPADQTRRLMFMPFSNIQQAFDRITFHNPDFARIAVMPGATHTIPTAHLKEAA